PGSLRTPFSHARRPAPRTVSSRTVNLREGFATGVGIPTGSFVAGGEASWGHTWLPGRTEPMSHATPLGAAPFRHRRRVVHTGHSDRIGATPRPRPDLQPQLLGLRL